jgi:hypothetical protein
VNEKTSSEKCDFLEQVTFNLEQEQIEPLEVYESEYVGNQEDFWTLNVAENRYEKVHATLLAVGNWSYIYMDNRTIEQTGQSHAIEKCEIYAEEFDSNIYFKNIEFMGHPDGSFGDVDGDPHITILIHPIQGAEGLHLETNEMNNMYSNHREMVYIHSNLNTFLGSATICHEFNHLILFNWDQNEVDFISEGIAEYSNYYIGYFKNDDYIIPGNKLNLSYSENTFEVHPEASLLYFS